MYGIKPCFLQIVLLITQQLSTYCEYCNLALHKPTIASCNKTDPCNAVDDNINHNLTFESCESDNPWWRVDLMDVYTIHNITITTVGHTSGNIFITISHDDDGRQTNMTRCNTAGEPTCIGEWTGRYVRVTDMTPSAVLQIKEAYVYEKLGRPCPDISGMWRCGNLCADAIEQRCDQCLCPCNKINSELRFYTEEEMQQKIAELVHELSIDKKNTALSKRKLISASDNRTSAAAVGSFGVIVLSLLLLGVVALDACRLACVVHCVKRFIQRRFK